MKRFLFALSSSALLFAAVAGCGTTGGSVVVEPVDPGSSAGMPPTVARLANDFERMCDHAPLCPSEAALSPEERADCLENARAVGDAACASEVLAVMRCTIGVVVCRADDGLIDDDASMAATESACAAENGALMACCEQHADSVLCGTEGGEDAPEGELAPSEP